MNRMNMFCALGFRDCIPRNIHHVGNMTELNETGGKTAAHKRWRRALKMKIAKDRTQILGSAESHVVRRRCSFEWR